MAKPKDTSFLEQHGPSWRVRVKVPDRLRCILGVGKLVAPLHTDSLAIANRDKHKHIHALKERIAAAEVELRRRSKKPIDPLVTEGLEWRQAYRDEEANARDELEGRDLVVSTALEARYEELVKADGMAKAETVRLIATGRATPIAPLADEWIAEKPLKAKQKLDYRRAVSKLEVWLSSRSLPPTLEAMTKQVASDYRSQAFIKAGVHARTANKDLSAISGLWKHAERKGLTEVNPWRGQFLPQTDPTSSQKRPFTDPEVARLLSFLSDSASPMKALLHDTVTVLALSGMRVEEWASLKVADLRGLDSPSSGDIPLPYIALRGTKTAAARRDVPIHPDALPIILRRAEGKPRDAYILDELRTPPEGSAWGRGLELELELTRFGGHL
jgi:hypothetical protein